MGALMNIEKLNEFNFLKEDVDKFGWKSYSSYSEKRRFVHSIEFLKDSFDFLWISNCFVILKFKYRRNVSITYG